MALTNLSICQVAVDCQDLFDVDDETEREDVYNVEVDARTITARQFDDLAEYHQDRLEADGQHLLVTRNGSIITFQCLTDRHYRLVDGLTALVMKSAKAEVSAVLLLVTGSPADLRLLDWVKIPSDYFIKIADYNPQQIFSFLVRRSDRTEEEIEREIDDLILDQLEKSFQ